MCQHSKSIGTPEPSTNSVEVAGIFVAVGHLHLSLRLIAMKRRTGDDDGSATGSDSSMRRRRRRRQMENNDEFNAITPREYPCITDLALTAPHKVPATTNTTHDIDKIEEHVFLPDYVREHNSTLTFPEKVCFVRAAVTDIVRSRGIAFLNFACLIVNANSNARRERT